MRPGAPAAAPPPRKPGVPQWVIPAAIVGVLAIVGIVVVASGGDDDEKSTGGTGVTTTVNGGSSTSSTTGPTTTFIMGPGEVLAEPADDVGPLPFTDPVVTDDNPTVVTTVPPSTTTTSVAGSTTTAPVTTVATGTTVAGETTIPTTVGGGGGQQPQTITPTPGDRPGLYGGTRNKYECDPEKMITFLEANPAKAAAWAGVQGILVSEIATYIRSLLPVTLLGDTRVTNYGFENGFAPARQVVLQYGTKVLVDDKGTPRARCYCGNPLGPPVLNPGPTTYTGKPWSGFNPTTIVVIIPANEPIDILILRDPTTLIISIGRPMDGGPDVDPPLPPPTTTVAPTTSPPTTSPPTTAAPATAPPTTEAPTTTVAPTTAPPTTEPPPAENIAKGSVTNVDASTTYTKDPTQDYSPPEAFDGDYTSSWFSAGDEDRTCVNPVNPGRSCSELVWENATETDVFIESLGIFNNVENPLLQTANKFGFNSVYVQVFALDGTRTFPADPNTDPAGVNFDLNGSGTDPNLDIPINVKGHRVVLLFEGHDDPTCGGISELEVRATPITGIV
jgi:hypothetical protein